MLKPFDANDARCIYPRYGQTFNAGMGGRSVQEIADLTNKAVFRIYAYRLGHSRNKPEDTAMFEKVLGVKLDMSEPSPGKRVAPSKQPTRTAETALAKTVLQNLKQIALAHGYHATFTRAA